MYFITSQDTLSLYIPNTLKAVQGEATLFDKLQPFLLDAENWLILHFIPTALVEEIDETAINYCRKAVSHYAFYMAAPSLDLILTPNGFGIVSNQNIAPASKERVQSLRQGLIYSRDTSLSLLLPLLSQIQEWRSSEQGRFFAATLFPDFRICSEIPDNQIADNKLPLWDKYLLLRSRIRSIETTLEADYFSTEQMQQFRDEIQADNISKEHSRPISLIRHFIICSFAPQPYHFPKHYLTEAVNIIRQDSEHFPLWHASTLPALFNPPVFQNKKSNAGYWF